MSSLAALSRASSNASTASAASKASAAAAACNCVLTDAHQGQRALETALKSACAAISASIALRFAARSAPSMDAPSWALRTAYASAWFERTLAEVLAAAPARSSASWTISARRSCVAAASAFALPAATHTMIIALSSAVLDRSHKRRASRRCRLTNSEAGWPAAMRAAQPPCSGSQHASDHGMSPLSLLECHRSMRRRRRCRHAKPHCDAQIHIPHPRASAASPPPTATLVSTYEVEYEAGSAAFRVPRALHMSR